MPQFDKITFFGQIFWFIIIFSTFYFLVSYKYVPLITLYLKIRAKKKLLHFSSNEKALHLIEKINVSLTSFFSNLSEKENHLEKFLHGKFNYDSVLWLYHLSSYKKIYQETNKMNVEDLISHTIMKLHLSIEKQKRSEKKSLWFKKFLSGKENLKKISLKKEKVKIKQKTNDIKHLKDIKEIKKTSKKRAKKKT
jgi:hypothetical protein